MGNSNKLLENLIAKGYVDIINEEPQQLHINFRMIMGRVRVVFDNVMFE